LLVIAVLGGHLHRPYRALGTALRQPLVSLVVFLTIAYLTIPYHFLAWHRVNIRLLPFICCLALGCAAQIPGLCARRATENGVLALVCIAVIGATAFITHEVLQMERMVAEYASGISKFPPNGRLLPIHLESSTFGDIRPVARAHEYYHIAKGGANGRSLAQYNTVSMVWYREYPVEKAFPQYDPRTREPSLRSVASAYDAVLVWGDRADIRGELREAGFSLVHEQGRLRLWRNTGTGLRNDGLASGFRAEVDGQPVKSGVF